jgi:hypothetical protein
MGARLGGEPLAPLGKQARQFEALLRGLFKTGRQFDAWRWRRAEERLDVQRHFFRLPWREAPRLMPPLALHKRFARGSKAILLNSPIFIYHVSIFAGREFGFQFTDPDLQHTVNANTTDGAPHLKRTSLSSSADLSSRFCTFIL